MSKGLDDIVAKLNKTYGQNTINRVKNLNEIEVERFSSGSLQLNLALGGGYPKGRIIEIYGPESSGKTTLALHAIAEVQKEGGNAAFVDAEQSIDTHYAENLGVDIDELILSQPDSGEQALEIVDALAKTGEIDLIVVDSVAALTPQSEIDGEMGDASVGKQARLMSQAMRKLTPAVKRTNCTIIFINQLRMKIGVMFGNPETQPGGNALKFYASQRIDIRAGQKIKDGDVKVGNKTKIKVVKNKVGVPHRTANTVIKYGHGIVREGEILDLAEELEIVNRGGSWYSYQGTKIGQGQANVTNILIDNPDLTDEIEQQILKQIT